MDFLSRSQAGSLPQYLANCGGAIAVAISKESHGTIGTALNIGKLFSNTDNATVVMIGDETAANDIDLYRVELAAGGTLTAIVQGGTSDRIQSAGSGFRCSSGDLHRIQ